MSNIAKESVNYSFISIIGLLVSVISAIFIYPLAIETYGIIQFIISSSNILLPIISFSCSSSIIYFYDDFNRDNLSELISLIFYIIIFIFLVMLIVNFVYHDELYRGLQNYNFNVKYLVNYSYPILFISLCLSFIALDSALLTIYQDIITPQLFTSLGIKIIISFLILGSLAEFLSTQQIVIILIGYYAISSFFISMIQRKNYKYSLVPITGISIRKTKKIIDYSLYNVLSGMGSTLAFRLDIIFVTLLVGAKEAGIYGLLLFMANIVEIPAKGFIRLVSPEIRNQIKNNNNGKLINLYKKSSNNLMLLGGFFALIIYAGLPSLFSLMNNGDILLKFFNVWILLALAKWIDMSTSINSQILSYSPYYRYNLGLLLLLALLNIILNYKFIELFGVVGAAIATAISISLYNMLKMLLIFKWYKAWPFNFNFIRGFFFLIVILSALILLPHIDNPILDILFRCGLTAAVFITMIYKTKLSPDINEYVLSKFGKFMSPK